MGAQKGAEKMGDRISTELGYIRMELRSIAELLQKLVSKKEDENDELPASEDSGKPIR